jgi:hypothetical protein
VKSYCFYLENASRYFFYFYSSFFVKILRLYEMLNMKDFPAFFLCVTLSNNVEFLNYAHVCGPCKVVNTSTVNARENVARIT